MRLLNEKLRGRSERQNWSYLQQNIQTTITQKYTKEKILAEAKWMQRRTRLDE